MVVRLTMYTTRYEFVYFKVSHPTRVGELSPSSGTLQSFIKIIKYHKYQISNFTKNMGYEYYTEIVNYM